jgi:hypothetical protein
MRSIAVIFAAFVLAGISLTSASCHKDTDCRALISCVDTLGRPVGNADVLLYAPVKPDGKTTYTADVKANGTTDSDGQVKFTFQLPAIFDIRATSVVGTRTLVGLSVIKLEEGKTVEKTVTLKEK